MKPKWERRDCGCVKANLPRSGKVMVRCAKHRGKSAKRALAYFDDDGIVRKECRVSRTAVLHVTPDPKGNFRSP